MSLLIFCIIAVLVLALAVWAIDMIPIDARFRAVIKVLAVLVAIIAIVQKAGLV